MNRLLVTQTGLHQVGPYKSLHVVLWSVGSAPCHRSVAESLIWSRSACSLWNYCSWYTLLRWWWEGLCIPWASRMCYSKQMSFCQVWFFFLSFAVCKLRGIQEPEQATPAHLESHGVSCSQEDPQRQLGFVGAVAPQAMRAGRHAQGRHQETEIGCKTQKQNTGWVCHRANWHDLCSLWCKDAPCSACLPAGSLRRWGLADRRWGPQPTSASQAPCLKRTGLFCKCKMKMRAHSNMKELLQDNFKSIYTICSNVLFSQGSLPSYTNRYVLIKTAYFELPEQIGKMRSPKRGSVLVSAQESAHQGTLLDRQWLDRNSQSAFPSM